MCQAFGQRSIRAITKLIYQRNKHFGYLPCLLDNIQRQGRLTT